MSASSENAFEALIGHLQEKRESISEAVSDGACKDYSNYREMVGQVRGINFAINQIKAMKKRIEEA